eukprot:GGOE01006698.1.p2 GENE.GGOE01006698.1~~GGOE01006698.1.p2  ORF type:complete len:312 (-),score=79.68 GGOE01006698.1:238-1131(-)
MSALRRLHTVEQHVSPRWLEGKVAIITGSGQGIGAAAAKLFAQHGAQVVVTDVDAAKADAVVREITSAGGIAIAVSGDLMDPAFPERLIKTTVDKFKALHFLVNNAGFTWDAMLHKTTDQQWEAMLTIHQTVPFRLVRAAAPYMRDAGKAEAAASGRAQDRCILNIASVSGTHGNVGQANYSTAKAGVLGLTKTICKEWGPSGVRCNVVAYGYIDTRLVRSRGDGEFMVVAGKKVPIGIPGGPSASQPKKASAALPAVPLGYVATPEDAAGALLLLCSPLASYISGQCLEVTGGAFV